MPLGRSLRVLNSDWLSDCAGTIFGPACANGRLFDVPRDHEIAKQGCGNIESHDNPFVYSLLRRRFQHLVMPIFPGYNGFGGGWNVGWVERRQLLGFATEFYQTNRYGTRNGWEASETQHETRSTQPAHCRSPKSVITRISRTGDLFHAGDDIRFFPSYILGSFECPVFVNSVAVNLNQETLAGLVSGFLFAGETFDIV